jgi:D-tyrosyl-tRNA(Tyr) deacylase
MPPEEAEMLYKQFCQFLEKQNLKVETGVFAAKMAVELINDGPVTIILEK